MSAALAWIDHALDTHGEVLPDGRMQVRRSQAALAEEAGCSAGTIAYYLRVLGDAVSVSRRDGLVVDRVALGGAGDVDELARRRGRAAEVAELLAQRWAGPADAGGRRELVDGHGRCPSVRDIAAALGLNPSTVQRHLDTLGREGRLLRRGRHLYLLGEPTSMIEDENFPRAAPATPIAAPARPLDPSVLDLLATTAAGLVRVAEELATLGRGLLELAAGEAATPTGTNASIPRPIGAPVAEIRDCAPTLADPVSSLGSRKIERGFLPVSVAPTSVAGDRENCQGPRGITTAPTSATPWRTTRQSTPDGIASALLPLQRACERLSLPSAVDERGRQWLSLYSPEELQRGVTQILRQLDSGAALATPLGLLISKAKSGNDDFFAPPAPAAMTPPLAQEPPSELDLEAAEALAVMSAEELDRLDEAVRHRLASVLGASRRRSIDGVLGSADGLAHWRATVWREQHSLKEGAV